MLIDHEMLLGMNGRFAPQAVFKARMRPLDGKAVILTAMVESQLSA
jgi:hypothetical protein